MNFRAEDYFRAATERMQQARGIYEAGKSYALAMYCAGLAVECLLRAFRWNKDPSFEGRHDLEDLLRASALLITNETWMRRQGASEEEVFSYTVALRAALTHVTTLWHNNLRFASVVQSYGGQNPGYIVTGRSLREIENRIKAMTMAIGLGWIITLLASLIVSLLLQHSGRIKHHLRRKKATSPEEPLLTDEAK